MVIYSMSTQIASHHSHHALHPKHLTVTRRNMGHYCARDRLRNPLAEESNELASRSTSSAIDWKRASSSARLSGEAFRGMGPQVRCALYPGCVPPITVTKSCVIGYIVFIRVLGRSILIVNSLQAALDLMEKRSAKYSDRPTSVIFTDL